jgi:hypothetical protein
MRTAKKTLRCTAKVAGPTCQPAVVRIGTRPVADKWGPSLPCASPPRRTAKTERQVGSLLCCAPDPEAHGKGCGGAHANQPLCASAPDRWLASGVLGKLVFGSITLVQPRRPPSVCVRFRSRGEAFAVRALTKH